MSRRRSWSSRPPRPTTGCTDHDAAQIGYHLRTTAVCDFTALGEPRKAFALWWNDETFRGRDATVVFDAKDFPDGMDRVKRYFERIEEPVAVPIPRFGAKKSRFLLLRAHGYRPPPPSVATHTP